jgi:hypothetical protein
MPSPQTALQLIRDGLGLTNAVGVDQTLSADEAADGLRVLNDLIENWSLQNLAVWGEANQNFSASSGQATYTIGVGGAWNSVRPVNIVEGYATLSNTPYPIYRIQQEEYNAISTKNQPGTPEAFLYVNDYPLGLITLWPVPDSVMPISFTIDRVISSISAVGDVISFPPGYYKAFKYALGVELAAPFGKPIAQYPEVVDIANKSLADVKRANRKRSFQYADPTFSSMGGQGARWVDWRRGY